MNNHDKARDATVSAKWAATAMTLITVGSYFRAAYDHVGLNVWALFSATPEVHNSIAGDFFFNFLFLNGVVLVGAWAALPSHRDRES